MTASLAGAAAAAVPADMAVLLASVSRASTIIFPKGNERELLPPPSTENVGEGKPVTIADCELEVPTC
ncbi:hypothetical protein [Pedobacter sp. GR22-10]|uniref:hypothetical protein n=1 Tax=Pedobacter sp. GR22-10 TaxID=2994472 RepID=UPI002248335E|nr:hypothetical protein [Pedobacter sp. GR22-10]MCX2432837.1 hypothetical protein [Pedobacter sp. GR22-10]